MLKQSGPTKPLNAVALHYQLRKQRKNIYILNETRLDVTGAGPLNLTGKLKQNTG